MYMYTYIGGWGAETNRKIVSFRSCVHAQLYVRSEWIWKIISMPFPFSPWGFFPSPLGDQVFPFPWDKWDQGNPSEIKWVQVSSSEVKWIQVNPSEIKWDQLRSSESKWTQVTSSESKWVQVRSSESKWTQVRSSESKWVKWDPLSPSEPM